MTPLLEKIKKSDFTITWKNELGSIVTLTYGDDGALTGTYRSGVGQQGAFPLSGRWDPSGSPSGSYACGWTVVWRNPSVDDDDVTAWSGQHQFDSKLGVWTITTTWLLTKDTPFQNNWQSTLVGQDIFTQV